MKRIVVLESFERSIKRLPPTEKLRLHSAIETLTNFILTGQHTAGLGFKKINHDKYEFRAGINLRIIIKADGEIYYLVLVGNHDDIRRYLRRHR